MSSPIQLCSVQQDRQHVNRALTIGILTGGGDCPGLNAVIRAVVRKAVDEYLEEHNIRILLCPIDDAARMAVVR